VEVVGVSPGYDLAVLALKLTGRNFKINLAYFQQRIQSIFLRRDLKEAEALRLGIAGDPDIDVEHSPSINADRHWETIVNPSFFGDHPMRGLKPWDSYLTLKEGCPALFVPKCYVMNLHSYGYSGGPFFIERERQKSERKKYSEDDEAPEEIVGIVSHFSPLASRTYAIPIGIALEVGEAILTAAKIQGRGIFLRDDLQHRFHYLAPQKVKIISGPWKGHIVQANSFRAMQKEAPGGGGDGSPGGGGDGSPGGGGTFSEAPQPETIYQPARARLLQSSIGVHEFESLDLLTMAQADAQWRKPENWATDQTNLVHRALHAFRWSKGIDSFLGLRPGIWLDDRLIFGMGDGESIENFDDLPQFLAAYPKFENRNRLDPQSAFRISPFAPSLVHFYSGIWTRSFVVNETYLKASEKRAWFLARDADRWDRTLGRTVLLGPEGALELHLNWVGKPETLTLKTAGPLRQTGGNTYEYHGPLVVDTCDRGWLENSLPYDLNAGVAYPSYGLLRIEVEGDRYELRMILATQFPSHALGITTLYLPLERPGPESEIRRKWRGF